MHVARPESAKAVCAHAWRSHRLLHSGGLVVRKFIEEIVKDDVLKAKIESLEGQDDAFKQAIAIAEERGFTLTEEELGALTEEDFKEEGASAELSLDDLDSAAGGAVIRISAIVITSRSQMHQNRNGNTRPS